ncbi:MAG: hypothetical protein F7C35_02185 [Desulfurococcales archaeon]|nr:hypothetical protein [Desulfurococcales archaeon]
MGPAEEFIAKYEEKGYMVLKAILVAARTRLGGPGLGDFSYKDVKRYLEKNGYNYNPSLLLSKLEREYGLIETTYKSGGQHWWKILDMEAIEDAVASYEGVEPEEKLPPRARLLKIQFYSLDPERILDLLNRLSKRRRLSEHERRLLKRIVFEDLPRLVDFLEEASSSYPEDLEAEIEMAEAILGLAEKLVSPVRGAGRLEEPPLHGIAQPVKHRLKGR